MARAAVSIDSRDLREFRRHLRGLGKEWPKQLRIIHRRIAEDVADKSKREARSLGGVQRHAADLIRPRASQQAARIGLAPSQGGVANVAFWGAKKRTGWNARNLASRPQHPEWVGATWRPGVKGEGPYAINDTIAEEVDAIVDSYGDAIDALARTAGFT